MQYNAPDFEIPTTVREIAGKSVDQAKDAYSRFVDAARQAQDMVSKSTEVFATGAREVNEKVFSFADVNTKSSFEAAARLAKARDIKEVLEIQTQFARNQIETYTQQAQELSRILAIASQKAQPAAAA
jgi:phasin